MSLQRHMERTCMAAACNRPCTEFSRSMLLKLTAKLAPCMDSQQNESLNGTIGSKNLKIRHYGGSASSDFWTACGVAQHNEGHKFVCKTLLETGINPGSYCTSHQEKEDEKASTHKQRKSAKKHKIRRWQLCLNKYQSANRNENKEGPSYGHNIVLNLVPQEVRHGDIDQKILKEVNTATCKTELEQNTKNSSAVRPSLNEISFDPQKKYTFILFDTETSSTARNTEILQLSAITDDGQHSFSEYILPQNSK